MRGTIQNGDKLGPFVIVAKLGRGGMSTVYSAYEAGLDREVALKVLPVDLLEEQGFTERFEREARLIAKLEHPHIVPLYSYGIDEGVPWMALRLVRGGHLGERMEREPLGVAQGLAYFTMIADALDHAHMMGVVHRDLKPQNVLLGERGELYLADFGISRLLQGRTTITNTGAVLGTPQYMSPEQAQDGHVGPMADIYALGVMVYQWLAGVLPFDADTPFAVMYKHVSQPPAMEPLMHLPERARAAMARALEKQQELRWPTAGAFIEELAAGLDQGALGPAQPDKDLPTGQVSKSVVAAISARRLHKVSNTGTDAAPVQVPVQVPAQAKASLRTPQPPAPTMVTGQNSATVVRAAPVQATPPAGTEPLPAASLQFRGKAATPPPPKKSSAPLLVGGIAGVVLLLAAGWWFTRGGDEGAVADAPPPGAAPADPTAAAAPAAPPPLPVGDARLLIESDARCELALDDVVRGVLEPLTPLRLELPAGDYQLRCTSTEHPEFVVAQVAKVVIEEPTVALFELKARIDNKVQKQQEEVQRMADEAKAEADARRQAEEREAEEALRLASEARQREQDQLAAETRKLEEARRAAEERRQAEARKLAEARAAVGRTRDGTPAASPAQARDERQDRRAAVADAARERERVRLAEAERVAAEKRQQEQARRLAEAQRIEKEAAAAAAAAAAASAQAAQAQAQAAPPPAPVPAAPPPRTTPIPMSTPQPAYPVDALRSKLTGDVDVSITIGRDGRVLSVRVISAKPRGVFERSVQETVKRWRFEPLDQEVTVTRTIRFR